MIRKRAWVPVGLAGILCLVIALCALPRMMLLEDGPYYDRGSVRAPQIPPPKDLTDDQLAVVKRKRDRVNGIRKRSFWRYKRYQVMTLASALSGILVAVAIQADSPRLVPVVLGAIAAAAQLFQLVYRDQELAINAQRAIALYDAAFERLYVPTDSSTAEQRFRNFIEEHRKIESEYFGRGLDIASQAVSSSIPATRH